MRVIVVGILCFFACNLLGQSTYYFPDEKIISYRAVDKPLKQVLIELSLKTNVNISFNERQIIKYTSISVAENGKSLGTVLKAVLQSTELQYKLVDRQIVIVRDYKALKESEGMITISGYLEDKRSLERLVNANIFLPEFGKGTTTNEYGFFSFSVPMGEQKIIISYLGYETVVLEQDFTENLDLDIQLSQNMAMEEVVITDEIVTLSMDGDSLVETRQIEHINMLEKLTNEQINSMVALGGESDIIKLTQFLPGINTGVDGFGGLFVRGGSKDQNLVLLDGIPVYNSDHAFGAFSVFNTEVIKDAKVYKSGIPARYEGRLSSVLDIRTKEGNRKHLSGNLTLGLFTAKASLEGPITDNKSSFLFSYRRSIIDPWVDELAKYIDDDEDEISNTSFSFSDFNGKLNFELSDKQRLYFSFYSGRDAFERSSLTGSPLDELQTSEDVVDWAWGNDLGVIRLNSQLSSKLFLNTSVYYNRYHFNSFDLNRFQSFDIDGVFDSEEYSFGLFNSRVLDRGVKMDWDLIPSTEHYLKFGASYISHEFNPGLSFFSTFVSNQLFVQPGAPLTKELVDAGIDELDLKGSELLVYIEDEIQLSQSFKLNVGIHNAIIRTGEKTYIRPQPRLRVVKESGRTNLFGSFGLISQYVQSITNSGLGFPADLWLSSTDQLAPQSSYYITAGLSNQGRKGFYFESEIYYKKFNQIVAFNEGGVFNIGQNENWEEQIPKGTGEAYGIEISMKKTAGKTNFFMNYTLSKAERNFPTINNGLTFAARYDRPHALKMALVHNFTENFDCSINWLFTSGSNLTLPTSFIEVPLPDGSIDLRLIYEEKNNVKLPEYHKLDIAFNLRRNFHWGSHKFTFGATNVYNRQNPLYIDIIRDLNNENRYTFKQFTLFPVMPTLSYSISF